MFILYNGNGSGSLEARLVTRIHDAKWSIVRAQASRAMRINGDGANVSELERVPYELWTATNGFGDEFEVLRALVPEKAYREMAGDVDTYQSKARYQSIFRALDNVGNRVRFIGMDIDAEDLTAAGDDPIAEDPPTDGNVRGNGSPDHGFRTNGNWSDH